mmetsp:Transcript_32070/g.68330  ORF Transcript_32070/g.68330 Transcript_32070/m.68330 type:complete len:241 (+) Transcript_32070:983-1705(+)
MPTLSPDKFVFTPWDFVVPAEAMPRLARFNFGGCGKLMGATFSPFADASNELLTRFSASPDHLLQRRNFSAPGVCEVFNCASSSRSSPSTASMAFTACLLLWLVASAVAAVATSPPACAPGVAPPSSGNGSFATSCNTLLRSRPPSPTDFPSIAKALTTTLSVERSEMPCKVLTRSGHEAGFKRPLTALSSSSPFSPFFNKVLLPPVVLVASLFNFGATRPRWEALVLSRSFMSSKSGSK